MPKFILQIAGQQFAVPTNDGVATLMKILADAIPVDTNLDQREITLKWDDKPHMLSYITEVRCVRIPPGTTWKRENAEGQVEVIRPFSVQDERKPIKTQRAIGGRKVLQLELGS